MRYLLIILAFVMPISSATAKGINKQFWGLWQPYSTTAISITGPIKIDEHHIEILYGHHVMEAEYAGSKIIKYLTTDTGIHTVAYKISGDTTSILIRSNQLCGDKPIKFAYFFMSDGLFSMRLTDEDDLNIKDKYYGCAGYTYYKE